MSFVHKTTPEKLKLSALEKMIIKKLRKSVKTSWMLIK